MDTDKAALILEIFNTFQSMSEKQKEDAIQELEKIKNPLAAALKKIK